MCICIQNSSSEGESNYLNFIKLGESQFDASLSDSEDKVLNVLTGPDFFISNDSFDHVHGWELGSTSAIFMDKTAYKRRASMSQMTPKATKTSLIVEDQDEIQPLILIQKLDGGVNENEQAKFLAFS